MLELIDRQTTLKKMSETCGYCERFEKAMRSTHPDFVTGKCNNYKFLAKQPTIEAEPVRHGHFENIPGMNNTVFCSECGAAADKYLAKQYKGCPFCLCVMSVAGTNVGGKGGNG
jgi:hypothetical protein